MDLNDLVFVDCYALSNQAPKVGDWQLDVEAYELVDKKNPDSGVKPGGPKRWRIIFKGIEFLSDLKVSKSFEADFVPGCEACEIYKLYSKDRHNRKLVVYIESDYLHGSFPCHSVEVRQYSELR